MMCESYEAHDWDYTGGHEHCRKCGASYMHEFHAEMYRQGYGIKPQANQPPPAVWVKSREVKMADAIRRVITSARHVDAGIYHMSADSMAMLKEAIK